MVVRRRTDEYDRLFMESGIDVPGRTIHVCDDIDDETLSQVTMGFHLMQEDSPITILLNSGGGDTISGMGIYDLIKGHSAEVTVRVIGQAMSMACVILQAADIRQSTPNSVLMHHVGQWEFSAGHPKNIKATLAFTEKHDARIDEIMLARINERNEETGREPWTMTRWRNYDTWDKYLFPLEAIELGLLDAIR
jgi:ATP-dependent Clp protease protease subunit